MPANTPARKGRDEARAVRPSQPPSLFFELIETVTTRDEPFEDRDGSWAPVDRTTERTRLAHR